MRERRPEDWRIDLAARRPLESEVKSALARHDAFVPLKTSTSSMAKLDFQVVGPGERLIEIELKEKRQRYRGWSSNRPDVPEGDLFILDELALRKLIDSGRYGILLIFDVPCRRWVVWTMADLVLGSKVRVNRRLLTASGAIKAKVLLDLREASNAVATLGAALDVIANEIATLDARWNGIGPWQSGPGESGAIA